MKTTIASFLFVAATGSFAFADPTAEVRHTKDAAVYKSPDGKAAARLFLDGSGTAFAFDELTLQTGAAVGPHKHDTSDEIIYILEGSANALIGGKQYKVGAGDVLVIPKGTEHKVVVEQTIKAMQVYSPGGPEQRFKGPPPKGAK